MQNITEYVNGLCAEVKTAQKALALAKASEKNGALLKIAEALRESKAEILKANEQDISSASENGVPKTMIDRLTLTEARIEAIADSLLDVAALPDPCGNGSVSVRPNGLKITKTSVPLGVIGIIYEARPNVTVDAAALCLKSGNGAVLKGGKEALNTNRALMSVMKRALNSTRIPPNAISLIDSAERAATAALMNARGLIDVLIPRGGKGLIKAVVENAAVPVIETGAGNCHIYIDESADLKKALAVAVNAKMSRPSVCNAVETMLVHEAVAEKFLPMFARETEGKLEIRGCKKTVSIIRGSMEVSYRAPTLAENSLQTSSVAVSPLRQGAIEATEQDYDTEFNDYVLAVKVVSSLDEAIEHIRRYSTGHSEAIITENIACARKFTESIDCAAVYVNASTRFTDGGEFGFGAEIGISTQKLHARGPMGLSELTTVKYIVEGDGQTR